MSEDGWGLEHAMRDLLGPLSRVERQRVGDALRILAEFVETSECVRCSNCRKRLSPGAFRDGKTVCANCQWRFGIRE